MKFLARNTHCKLILFNYRKVSKR